MLKYTVCFMAGMMLSWFFSYFLSIAHSIIVLRRTQRDSAVLFLASEQGLQEILHLKYIAMQEAKRSEQNITAQKYIDQMNIASIKKSIMKNYIITFPSNYRHILEYTTWEEMEDFVNKVAKEKKKKGITDDQI